MFKELCVRLAELCEKDPEGVCCSELKAGCSASGKSSDRFLGTYSGMVMDGRGRPRSSVGICILPVIFLGYLLTSK